MNIQTAKEILGLNRVRKQSVNMSFSQPKTSKRIILTRQTKSRDKRPRKTHEQVMRQLDITEPQVVIHTSPLIETEDRYQQKRSSQQTHILNNLPHFKAGHRFSHYNHLNIAPLNVKQNNINVTAGEAERMPKTARLIRSEIDTQPKPETANKPRTHVTRRPVKTGNRQEKQSSLQAHSSDQKTQDYYVSDLKKSVHEYMNDRQFESPHLNHFMDSFEAFETHAHTITPKQVLKAPVELPKNQGNKITIVFDLDETLVHTQVVSWDSPSPPGDWGNQVEICTQNGDYRLNVKLRPHAVQVLTRLKQKFQLGVFTASQEAYGSKVAAELDPHNSIFSFKLYRQHCYSLQSRNYQVKDLRILKDRDLARIILIDNSPQTYLFQKSNAVPIVPFFSNKQDKEMLKLQKFLNGLCDVADVRPVLQNHFKFEQYNNYKNIFRLVRELY